MVFSTAGKPILATAGSNAARLSIAAQAAVGTPASRKNDFSATRSWLIRSTDGEGRTGRIDCSRSSPVALTFSNSKVMTSTAAAKARNASWSS